MADRLFIKKKTIHTAVQNHRLRYASKYCYFLTKFVAVEEVQQGKRQLHSRAKVVEDFHSKTLIVSGS